MTDSFFGGGYIYMLVLASPPSFYSIQVTCAYFLGSAYSSTAVVVIL